MSAAPAEAYLRGEARLDLAAARKRLGEAMPEDGWLREYLLAVTPLTDAPVEFHLASGLAALATAVGNRLWVESWGMTVYPHLWVVLVAPSSFWRKSTAITSAERLVRAMDDQAVYPSDFSRERFLKVLSTRPTGLLTLKEFGGFLAALGRDYMGGLKETLTELYDGPDKYVRSLQSGEITVTSPAITLLAATTLEWLEGKITEGDLAGGFLGRFLFVTGREKAASKSITGGMDMVARMRLEAGLRDVQARPATAARIEPAALQLLDAWMRGWEHEVTRSHHRADLTGFAVRLQTYALKLAMLYRVSACAFDEAENDTVVDEASAARAIAYCRVLWENVAELVDEKIAIGRDAKELRRIKGIVGEGVAWSDALRLSKMRARDFEQFMDTLQKANEMRVTERRTSELGLERARDTKLRWIEPTSSSSSLQFTGSPTPISSRRIPVNPSELVGRGNGVNQSELEGPSLISSSLSTSLHTHHTPRTSTESAREIRAGELGTDPADEPPVPDTPPPDLEDQDEPMPEALPPAADGEGGASWFA